MIKRFVATLTIAATFAAAAPAGATSAPPLDASFTAYMGQIADAIARNASHSSNGLFYPASAYVALKTGRLGGLSPLTDYSGRLLAFYQLDVTAYYKRLFSKASTTYIGARFGTASENWIPAGACENNTGYWHLNGVRLLFRRYGQVVSVRVNSLITAGNRWWVVHLGPNPRPVNVGTVDGFAVGTGTLLPAAGC
jgi:hypothetical protein